MTSSVDPVLKLLSWLVFGQSAFLAAAVFARKGHVGNRYLAVFVFLLGLQGLTALAWNDPEGWAVPEAAVLFSGIPFLYGPLVYRYVWHGLYRDWRDRIPFIVHGFPAAANFLLYLGIYLAIGREAFAAVAEEVYAGGGPAYVRAIEVVKIAYGVAYAILILRLVHAHADALRRWAAREHRRRWLRALAASFFAAWVLVLLSSALQWTGLLPNGAVRIVTAVQLASFLAFVYMVTFFAIRFPAVLEPKEVREEIRKKLNLPDRFVEITLSRLRTAVDKGFHRNPEITLSSLADRLGLHPNALSYIINEETGMGFRRYLNGLRLEEFLKTAAGNRKGRTYLEMAFESGFSSKTTFLRAFRARYGATPAEYFAGKTE